MQSLREPLPFRKYGDHTCTLCLQYSFCFFTDSIWQKISIAERQLFKKLFKETTV
ncbi:unnamed protein product [Cuscuta europaea]|uniref:Uncharacterized protein n=1 Tax=Cuscuta europaea TaxID=41803 RepID=A0A9P0ZX31_CUSEU|nr:unnamed protein product [Cuscuta europaea]